MVVGICNAADRNDHAGYCAALPTIHAEMDRAGVGFVYKEEPKETWSPALLAAADPPAAPPAAVAAKGAAHEPGEAATLAPGEQAALEKIQRRLKEGAEVVVVIRNGRDGQEKNEVIRLDHASPAFLANWQPPTAAAGTCTTPPWSGRRSWSGTRKLVISTTSRSPRADRPVRSRSAAEGRQISTITSASQPSPSRTTFRPCQVTAFTSTSS